jgi:hypothetical protein
MSVRVIVCGSRSWSDRQLIQDTLVQVGEGLGHNLTIVHGNARGADRIAKQEAEKAGYLVEPHDYRDFISPRVSPKVAPLVRNRHMAILGAQLCVAFWDGRSTGTKHMMDCAEARGIPVRIIRKGKVPA